MADASFVRNSDDIRLVAGAAVTVGELWQLPDGRAGYYTSSTAATVDQSTKWRATGQVVVPKATGVKALKGGRAFWDHSANNATYKKVGDRDFYAGRWADDAAEADTTATINLNVDPPYDIDLLRDPYATAPVGTQALGGFLPPQRNGGALHLLLSATNEAQKVDALSVDTFHKNANGIVELIFRVISDGSGSAADFSIGIASGTHATDADSIANHLLVHLDANDTDINLQSKDGTTTVASTDTTINYTEGAELGQRVEVWFDMRTPADVQCYVNGALVLGSTVFDLSAAANELRLLAHLEKTSSTDTYEIAVDRATVRLAEQ